MIPAEIVKIYGDGDEKEFSPKWKMRTRMKNFLNGRERCRKVSSLKFHFVDISI
jgi:hypothetical protein